MSATPVPQRTSLVSQTVAVLEAGVRGGRWTGELPGQHTLCAELMISRKTLRNALQSLAAQGLIDLHQGRPSAIRRQPRPAPSARVTEAVLLLPEPLWRLRPSVARWASELRPLLLRAGLDFTLREGGRYYRANPAPPLARLVATHPHAAWILFASTEAMQRWFAQRGLPTILVGSVFPGMNLPSIEYDHAAIAGHAAARLAAAGHRRTAILVQRTGSAADATTCESFARGRRPDTPAPVVLEHDGTLAKIESQLRRLAALRDRPTGLFVTKSLAIPAAYTLLPRLGLQIPRDLSVVCREDDTFLEYLVPSLARYRSDSSAIARKLALALTRVAHGQPLPARHERLMPQFVAGKSIGAAPGGP